MEWYWWLYYWGWYLFHSILSRRSSAKLATEPCNASLSSECHPCLWSWVFLLSVSRAGCWSGQTDLFSPRFFYHATMVHSFQIVLLPSTNIIQGNRYPISWLTFGAPNRFQGEAMKWPWLFPCSEHVMVSDVFRWIPVWLGRAFCHRGCVKLLPLLTGSSHQDEVKGH